jgi:hypothetical protein
MQDSEEKETSRDLVQSRVQENPKKSRGAGMAVCGVCEDKGASHDNEDKGTEKVQR